jgi:hypothetical protein
LKVFVVFNKKELPAGARFVFVFLVVFRLVCVHRLRHIPSSIANRNSKKNTILFSFWPRLFGNVFCVFGFRFAAAAAAAARAATVISS